MRTRAAVAAMMLVCCADLSRGQDDKAKEKDKDPVAAARADLEKKAAIAAYEAAVVGTDIFNKDKNYEGCYRLYQGTLTGLLPAIDHQVGLASSVRAKLGKAKGMSPGEGAGVLREALDEVQELGRVKKPLWERIGGEAGAKRIVEDFVKAATEDPKVNYTRGAKYPVHAMAREKLNGLLVEQLSFLTGGPGKDQLPELLKLHEGINFTDAEQGKIVEHLIGSLFKNNVSPKDVSELLKTFKAFQTPLADGKK
jgi:hemoglobin